MGLLGDLRVLDLSDERGLLAGRLLADLGADVVQVEPVGGSSARRSDPQVVTDAGVQSMFWDAYAANKRGVVVDLDTIEGQGTVRSLVGAADFLIESADPGVMARAGLDWAVLQTINPSLVYVSITAFGGSGPKALYSATDLTVWASGGPLDGHRDGDRPPLRISIPQAFLHAAADAAAGALIAHRSRLRTGRGQHVDVSAQACLGLATLGQSLAHAVGDSSSVPVQKVSEPDSSGSGSGTDVMFKKWSCRDGSIEFHLGMGPAAGGFTGSFFGWLAAEGEPVAEFVDVDWRQVPAMLRSGSLDPEFLTRARMAVGGFLIDRTKDEVLRAAVERKLLCVPLYETDDVAASRQLAERGYWIEVGEGGRRRRLPGRFVTMTPEGPTVCRPAPLVGEHNDEVLRDWRPRPLVDVGGDRGRSNDGAPSALSPLDGLKVVDLSWVVAGPVIGRALADFGATVVRVESATRPETARHMPPFRGTPSVESSALYATSNAGKLGLTLDLTIDAAREVAGDLASWGDVVVEAFSPGQMRRWGLDYDTLKEANPGLIMLSTSIMGQTGSYSRLAGYGNVGAALAGFQTIVGWPDRPPIGPYGPYTDFLGPRLGLVALLAALEQRDRTGAGCFIDVSQVEAGVFFQSPYLARYALTAERVERMGNADESFHPHGVYRCLADEDGERFVAIAVRHEADWRQLADVVGRSDMAADPLLATAAGRRAQATLVDDAIALWTSTRRPAEVELELQRRGVPAHVSASSRDLAEDPQLRHRNHFVTMDHPTLQTVTVEGPRYLLSETPGVVRRPAPTFGRDNLHVLRELLDYTPERIAELEALGALR